METQKKDSGESFSLEHRVPGQGWDGSRDVGSGNKRHDGDHGKTSVVQFTVSLALHCGFIHAGEVDWRKNNGGKISSLCVVCSLRFGNDFSKEDGSNNLLLSCTSKRKQREVNERRLA